MPSLVHRASHPPCKHVRLPEGGLCLEHSTFSSWDPQEQDPASRGHSLGVERREQSPRACPPREKASSGEPRMRPGIVQGHLALSHPETHLAASLGCRSWGGGRLGEGQRGAQSTDLRGAPSQVLTLYLMTLRVGTALNCAPWTPAPSL